MLYKEAPKQISFEHGFTSVLELPDTALHWPFAHLISVPASQTVPLYDDFNDASLASMFGVDAPGSQVTMTETAGSLDFTCATSAATGYVTLFVPNMDMRETSTTIRFDQRANVAGYYFILYLQLDRSLGLLQPDRLSERPGAMR